MKVFIVNLLGHEVRLAFTKHSLKRLKSSRLPIEKLIHLLKEKKVKIVEQSGYGILKLQVDCIELVINSVLLVVITVVVTTVDRAFIESPTLALILERWSMHSMGDQNVNV